MKNKIIIIFCFSILVFLGYSKTADAYTFENYAGTSTLIGDFEFNQGANKVRFYDPATNFSSSTLSIEKINLYLSTYSTDYSCVSSSCRLYIDLYNSNDVLVSTSSKKMSELKQTGTPEISTFNFFTPFDLQSNELDRIHFHTFACACAGDHPNYIKVYVDQMATNNIPRFTLEYEQSVEIIELPDWTGQIFIGSDENIDPMKYTKCIIGQECRLWFNYGYQAIDGNAYLFTGTTTDFIVGNALDSKELILKNSLDNYYIIDDPGAPAVQDYIIYYLSSTQADTKVYGGVVVEWVYDDFEEFNVDCDEVCADIATSSVEWWDPTTYAGAFRYAVECGLRKTSCYLFTPSVSSRNYFDNSRQKIKGTFPFNTYFSLSDAVYTAIASTSTSTVDNLGIPFISATSSEYYIMPVLNSDSMSNAIGEENANSFRTGLGWFMWIITACLILSIVYFSFF